MTKHKHADLIHAWADGAKIEYLMNDEWKPIFFGWSFDNQLVTQYRIKPEEKKPVVRWLWAKQNELGKYSITTPFLTEEEAKRYAGYRVKLEWSRTEFPE